MPLGIYLHIPYCISKCNYCNFYSAGGHTAVPEEYIAALTREIRTFAPKNATSIYFGGGTPSLLTPNQVRGLIKLINPAPGAEITLEINPGTATLAKFKGYYAAGVNRLSIGVQTAKNASLARLGRPHNATESRRAFALAKTAGFTNISGDIMLALPNYTKEELEQTIALIKEGGGTHISAYLLKIEPSTPFGQTAPEGLPDDDTAADFYLMAVELLENAGYAQYEISNFAQPGFEGKHNLTYWNCHDYLSFGPGAHSCKNGVRFHYPPSTAGFINGKLRNDEDGNLDAEDYIMLRLRLNAGLALDELERRFGEAFAPWQLARVQTLAGSGFCRFDGKLLQLTANGFLMQNAVLGQLLVK